MGHELCLITVPADGLSLNGARPLEETVLNIKAQSADFQRDDQHENPCLYVDHPYRTCCECVIFACSVTPAWENKTLEL